MVVDNVRPSHLSLMFYVYACVYMFDWADLVTKRVSITTCIHYQYKTKKKKTNSSILCVRVCMFSTEKGSTVCNDKHCNNGITDVSLGWKKMYGLKPINMPVKIETKNKMNKYEKLTINSTVKVKLGTREKNNNNNDDHHGNNNTIVHKRNQSYKNSTQHI